MPDARSPASRAGRADRRAAARARSAPCWPSAAASPIGGRAVILVTHKLAEIAKVADRVTVLRARPGGRRRRAWPSADMRRAGPAPWSGRELRPLGRGARRDRRATSSRAPAAPNAALVAPPVMRWPHRAGPPRRRAGSTTSPWSPAAARSSALAGVEGNGQSELGMVLAGLLRPTEGRVLYRRRRSHRTPAPRR